MLHKLELIVMYMYGETLEIYNILHLYGRALIKARLFGSMKGG